MSIQPRRWPRSKAGRRITAGVLTLLAVTAILGQLLGWWLAVLKHLQGTAGTEGVLPSQVQLAYFTASAADGQAAVSWVTEIETYNAGFNLYRAEQGGVSPVRVNTDLIPSQATEASTSASYEFVDSSVSENSSYEYRLESIDQQSLPTYWILPQLSCLKATLGRPPEPSTSCSCPSSAVDAASMRMTNEASNCTGKMARKA
jgi:hypothetical protein